MNGTIPSNWQSLLGAVIQGQGLSGRDRGLPGHGKILGYLKQARREAFPVGFENLMGILRSQGHIDPELMNRQLADIQNATQAGQMGTQGRLAELGLEGSAAGQAIMAAQGAAGTRMQSDVRLREAQMAEERKRQDLMLLLNLIINPDLAREGMKQDKWWKEKQYKMFMDQMAAQSGGGFGSALGGIAGGMLGSMAGPIGTAIGSRIGSSVGSSVD